MTPVTPHGPPQAHRHKEGGDEKGDQKRAGEGEGGTKETRRGRKMNAHAAEEAHAEGSGRQATHTNQLGGTETGKEKEGKGERRKKVKRRRMRVSDRQARSRPKSQHGSPISVNPTGKHHWHFNTARGLGQRTTRRIQPTRQASHQQSRGGAQRRGDATAPEAHSTAGISHGNGHGHRNGGGGAGDGHIAGENEHATGESQPKNLV